MVAASVYFDQDFVINAELLCGAARRHLLRGLTQGSTLVSTTQAVSDA